MSLLQRPRKHDFAATARCSASGGVRGHGLSWSVRTHTSAQPPACACRTRTREPFLRLRPQRHPMSRAASCAHRSDGRARGRRPARNGGLLLDHEHHGLGPRGKTLRGRRGRQRNQTVASLSRGSGPPFGHRQVLVASRPRPTEGDNAIRRPGTRGPRPRQPAGGGGNNRPRRRSVL